VRVFLAGATGAIGRQLVPLLLAAGHEVTGTTRSEQRAAGLRELGAHAAILDALDAAAVRSAVAAAAPDAVIHQLTAIPPQIDPRKMAEQFELNDRLRSEGTKILVDAAAQAGAERIVAQSIAFSYRPGGPGTLHREEDPLITAAEATPEYARSAEAVRALEQSVLGAGGAVLRYGYFYGPGTAISREGSTGRAVAARKLPIVGGGHGVWPFVHIADAAEATLAALERGASGPYNVVDDDPAPVREWIPALASALGAPSPRSVPAWLARPLAGRYGLRVMTRAEGASNERAERELGWQPRYGSWREGFRTALG
jgi:nucleoside-diphosphate-sugar epimerase